MENLPSIHEINTLNAAPFPSTGGNLFCLSSVSLVLCVSPSVYPVPVPLSHTPQPDMYGEEQNFHVDTSWGNFIKSCSRCCAFNNGNVGEVAWVLCQEMYILFLWWLFWIVFVCDTENRAQYCVTACTKQKQKLWRIHRVLKTEFYINFKIVEKVAKDHPKREKAKNFLRFPGKTFFASLPLL